MFGKFAKLSITLIHLLALSACADASTLLPDNFRPTDNQTLLTTMLSVFLGILVIALIFLVRQLTSRFHLLRYLGLNKLLNQIPGLEKYRREGEETRREFEKARRQVEEVERAVEHDTKTLVKRPGDASARSASLLSGGTWASLSETASDQLGRSKRQRIGFAQYAGMTSAASQSTEAVVTASVTLDDSPAEPVRGLSPVGRLPVKDSLTAEALDASSVDPAQLIGQRLGRYQIDALIEKNRYRQLYQAFDLKLERPVRLQLVHTDVINSTAQQELLQSIRTASALDHAAILDLYDYDVIQNQLVVVNDFSSGTPIHRFVAHMAEREETIRYSALLDLFAQVAEGIHYAHEHDVIHAGLTPDQILVESSAVYDEHDFYPRVAGFGLESLYWSAQQAPRAVWPYISPEQCRGESIDEQADIYMLGAVLYHVMTKRTPFDPQSVSDTVTAHTLHTPAPINSAGLPVPKDIESIILTAMAREPDKRFASARDFANALRNLARAFKANELEHLRATQTKQQFLHIERAGELNRFLTLDRNVFYIGSTPGNDIVLSAPSVSAQHGQLVQSDLGWHLIDLGSEAGITVSGLRLLPELPELLGVDQPATIGPYTLTLSESAERDKAAADQAVLELSLLPTAIKVTPGRQVDLQVHIGNLGTRVDHFHFEIEGIPLDWVVISENPVDLMPSAQQFLLLSIAPPLSSDSKAGEYLLKLTARPLAQPDQMAAAECVVTVEPFEHITLDLHPGQLHNAGTTHLQLENLGNMAAECQLEAYDPISELTYKFKQDGESITSLSLAPAEQAHLAVFIAPKQRPWVGSTRQIPFELAVTTQQSQPYLNTGQLELSPRIPLWLMSLLVVLLPLLCLALSSLDNLFTLGSATPEPAPLAAVPVRATSTPTAIPSPTPVPPPASCLDVKRQNQRDALDGEYELFLQHDATQPIIIYCHNMQGMPSEYVSLAADVANYAAITYPTAQLTTNYQRVRINLTTLTIDPTDRTFAQTTGALPEPHKHLDGVDFGFAMGCDSAAGSAIVDLNGLDLTLANSETFAQAGPNVSGSANISPSRRVVQIAVSGTCGWVTNPGGIQLDYNRAAP